MSLRPRGSGAVRFLLLPCLFISFLCSCATRQRLAMDYQYEVKDRPSVSARTVIFFLVDGLPVETLRKEMSRGKLPNLSRYFTGRRGGFDLARTVFPSLTYPAIASLLTEKPVDQSGVVGNLQNVDGKVINFESPSNSGQLNQMITGRNIFARLKAKGLRTASLDYYFHADSAVHTQSGDVEAGLSYIDQGYAYVDQKTLESLELLLTGSKPSQWPDFVFVHLIGVDLMSHDKGPFSTDVTDYLETLDSEIGRIFFVLDQVEGTGKREVMAMLSADHGFDNAVTTVVHLEDKIEQMDDDTKFLDEGRFASLIFSPKWTSARKATVASDLTHNPLIDIVAFRDGGHVYVESSSRGVVLTLAKSLTCVASGFSVSVADWSKTSARNQGPSVCPDDFDDVTNNLYYPYFIANLSHYFNSPSAPDMVVIPRSGVALNRRYIGRHGGPTAQETFVPLLIHNGSTTALKPGRVPALSELLGFM